ncbi:MAG: anaerobic sulfite reductase subunit B [Alphaproteobacteria bacterium]|jgi:anaerobic sulfite reductase subunit B
MLQLTPSTIRIVDFYDDGTDTRHFTFEPKGFVHESPIAIGQFFMLTVPSAGLAPFTYTSFPDNRGRFNALIRKVGKLTQKLFTLKKGDLVGYNGPYGNGWPIAEIHKKEVLIVAGGCGLAPVSTAIEYLIEQGRANSVTLLYASRDQESQVLKQERARWQSKIKIYETLDTQGDKAHFGLPTEHLSSVLRECQRYPNLLLTCGPELMMRNVAKICMGLGFKSTDIWITIERRMRCGVGLCGHCYIGNSYACKQGPTYSYGEFVGFEKNTSVAQPYPDNIQYC